MLIVTGREMAALDARARDEYGLPELVLMENAGREVAACLAARFEPGARIAIVCGSGNNGGDGLVAARHLHLGGREVQLWLAGEDEAYRDSARVNLEIAKSLGLNIRRIPVDPAENEFYRKALGAADVLVDALFGTGFHGPPRPEASAIIRAINQAGLPVVAVDIPSGVEADTGAVHGEAVRASITVTFALPKLGCLLYPGAEYTGELITVPISLPVGLMASGIDRYLIEAEEVGGLLPRRPRQAHKGLSGRILVVGGSPGLTGAPFLAARGALRAGAGLVTAVLPLGSPLVEKPAEVMVGLLPAGQDGSFGAEAAREILPWLKRADVVAIGPGLGQSEGAWAVLEAVLQNWSGPLIVDADALNMLAGRLEAIGGANAVLTPHPGEMSRLLGWDTERVQSDRVGCASRMAGEYGVTVVLKGVPTVVASPSGRICLNPSGDPAMAAGGMGDVLTGVIAGLAAQGLTRDDAAIAGVYLHGTAGELAAAAIGGPGVLAREVADALPAAMRKVKTGCLATRS